MLVGERGGETTMWELVSVPTGSARRGSPDWSGSPGLNHRHPQKVRIRQVYAAGVYGNRVEWYDGRLGAPLIPGLEKTRFTFVNPTASLSGPTPVAGAGNPARSPERGAP
jgi:hypothetical protein